MDQSLITDKDKEVQKGYKYINEFCDPVAQRKIVDNFTMY